VEGASGKVVNEQRCPICASDSLSEFLTRKQVPVHQNLLMHDQLTAVNIPRGDLALTVCEDCGFIFNRAFDSQKPLYGEGYENTQACSPSFNKYLDELVRHLVVERGVRNCQVVEVGCGNGLFLRKLVTYEEAGNRGHGFDPSYSGPGTDLDGRLSFSNRYYDADCAGIPAGVVVSRHVIEHVPQPLQLLLDIKKALAHTSDARIFFETPCVKWILRNEVIWDFFFEHCSYFTAQSLSTAFQLAGFGVESVEHVFGGQYLWLEGTLPVAAPPVTKHPDRIVSLAKSFARAEAELERKWRQKIQNLRASGKVALWGAGAKGVTFANMIDPERCWIDCIVDLNPLKQGHFVPGTGHPIVSHTELISRGVTSAILMNPNYRDENLALLSSVKTDVRLIEGL
jgi:SAM-dependent methyltransferase